MRITTRRVGGDRESAACNAAVPDVELAPRDVLPGCREHRRDPSSARARASRAKSTGPAEPWTICASDNQERMEKVTIQKFSDCVIGLRGTRVRHGGRGAGRSPSARGRRRVGDRAAVSPTAGCPQAVCSLVRRRTTAAPTEAKDSSDACEGPLAPSTSTGRSAYRRQPGDAREPPRGRDDPRVDNARSRSSGNGSSVRRNVSRVDDAVSLISARTLPGPPAG